MARLLDSVFDDSYRAYLTPELSTMTSRRNHHLPEAQRLGDLLPRIGFTWPVQRGPRGRYCYVLALDENHAELLLREMGDGDGYEDESESDGESDSDEELPRP